MKLTGNVSEKQKATKTENKKKLRAACLKKRNELPPEKRMAVSEKIKQQVFASKAFQGAETVFVYASYKSEVDTKNLIRDALQTGKRVAVPKVHGSDMDFYEISSWEELFPGYRGILEPQTQEKEPLFPQKSDVMLFPGAVFDCQGDRIGYGGGFYDRYISKIEHTCKAIPYRMALAFPCQLVLKKLPTEEHDQKMDCILTGRSVIMPKKEKYCWLEVVENLVEFLIDIIVDFLD